MLTDERLATSAQEAAEDERDDHDVVELTGDRDEVGHEIEGEREVAGERDEQRFLATRQARVSEQSAAEDDAVGMKPARARALSRLPAMTSARTRAA